MQFINILFALMGFLGLAFAQDAAATTSVVSSSTETLTRTIRVSQISTVTSLVTFASSTAYVSHNSTLTTLSPSSTKVTLTASAPAGTGGVVPTKSGSPPVPTDFKGAAPALSAFGAAGVVAMAFAAML